MRGFTLTELIMTIVIVGVLAVVVLPRFDSLDSFDAAGAGDQVRSLLRFGQRTAVAQRRNVAVTYSPTAAGLCSYTGPALPCSAGCAGAPNATLIGIPGGDFRASAKAVFAGGTVCFDAAGRSYLPSGVLAATLTIDVSDGVAVVRSIRVEPETGHVH